jgi:helicase C-terminal domain protein
MDRNERTAHLIKELNLYKRYPKRRGVFVKSTCDYYDAVKLDELTSSDLNFLRYIANEAGVPQYFELLERKYQEGNEINPEDMNLLSMSSFFNEANLIVNDYMLHKYQKEVLELFENNSVNRYILSAPTSFGKTFIVYTIIKKMNYSNILLVFPTISLLSENYLKLQNDEFFSPYKIHTLSEINEDELGEKNIFIYTPERYLSFLDNNTSYFDFTFVDEIYKIDNDFIIDNDTPEENERDTAYRLALEYACQNSKDILLAGPYIQFQRLDTERNSFNNFVRVNKFTILEYNDVEIVSKNITHIDRNKFELGNIKYKLNVGTSSLQDKVVQTIVKIEGNTLIYCGSKRDVERFVNHMLKNEEYLSLLSEKEYKENNELFSIFLKHIEKKYGSDWILYKALEKRIGLHHAGIPKYLQNEIINLFNSGELLCLFSTTTITEGVNTTAKNLIVTAVKKGRKPLKQFDAKNIAGRSGRFNVHYSGNVIDLTKQFETLINSQQAEIEHKNYDNRHNKTDIDLEVTLDEFLTDDDRKFKDEINEAKQESGLPNFIFHSYKAIGPLDKISIYNRIKMMSEVEFRKIDRLKQVLSLSNGTKIHWEGFQIVVDICRQFISNSELKQIMETRVGNKNYSLIVVQLSGFLEKGFLGTVDYYVKQKNYSKDKAISETSKLIYTIFKYHLVKYLGVFDLLYRFHYSQVYRKDFDNVTGIQILLQRLEYNALTNTGRKLSDFGVPFELVKYYDGSVTTKNFDLYESYVDKKIQNLLK